MLVDLRDRTAARRLLDEAWEEFLRGGEPGGVRPEIARSWRRSRDVHRVDAALRRAPPAPGPDAALRREEDEVFGAASPVLSVFAPRLAEQGHVLAWVDREGCLLCVAGDPHAVERLADVGFSPGASWREEAAGTAAPGLALAERRAVEVFASEHWVRAFQGWTGAAAPVLAPGSPEPAGCVALAGPWDARDPQALLAAAAIAAAVEERVRAAQAVRDEVVRHALRAARAGGDALLAVDGRGRLVAASEGARRRLGVEGELPDDLAARVAALLRGAPAQEEIALEWPGAADDRRRVLCAPVGHGGRAVGAVLRVVPGAAARPSRAAARPRSPAARYGLEDVLGGSERLRAALELARVAARNDLPVVLHGESGTGKELFAHGIHAESARGEGPFVTVNCGAIPAPLVEAELFGYEAGTFTGAAREGRAGKLEEAHGGTLFLDEVSELAPAAQTAILRALQESEVVRVGGYAPRRVDARIVAATNRRLWDEVAAGRFREDLFFRLNVLSIDIPALRDRAGDVPVLASAFLAEAESKIGRAGLQLSAEAMDALARHPWPGNARELRNVILRAAATARGARIAAEDLQLTPVRAVAPAPAAFREDAAPAALAARPGEPPEPERDELVAALDACGWNIARTATTLGVSRMTLYRRLRRFGITR